MYDLKDREEHQPEVNMNKMLKAAGSNKMSALQDTEWQTNS
jgi:hypothetical protein